MNICDENLGTKISCSQVCHDDYDVNNLIAFHDKQFRLKRGFMADSFVKPPIDVIINLPVLFEVSHIVLQTRIGAQKTSCLEIFSCLTVASKDKQNDDYSSVAKIISENVDNVCVFNEWYSQYRNLTLINDLESKFQYIIRRRSRMCVASSIKLQIKNTLNGSVPALNKIEIWGYPEKSCPKEYVEKLLKVLRTPNRTCDSQIEKKAKVADVEPNTVNHEKMPSEFLDPISCELMTLPVILPSGHTIDRSTLDKHSHVEEQWGRSANDPFTGLPFSKDTHPLPNVALKARIDDFVLKNNHMFKAVPRTVGRDPVKRKILVQQQSGMLTSKSYKVEPKVCVSSTGPDSTCREPKKVKLEGQSTTESVNYCHEEQLSSSLSAAIGQLLKQSSLKKSYVEKIVACVLCNGNKEALYKCSCEHLICGPCLKRNVDKCSCGQAIVKGQVHRVHI